MSFTIPNQDRQPVDWPAVESAIHDFVDDVLGIPFIFENQNLPQPEYPYASGSVSSILTEGGIKEQRHQFNAANDVGEEIDVLICGTTEFTLSISVHVGPNAGAFDPFNDAKMFANRLQWSLDKTSSRAFLKAARISIVENLACVDSSVVVNGEWLSRYTWDVRLRAPAVVSEKTTYIDKTTVSGTFADHSALDFSETWDSTA